MPLTSVTNSPAIYFWLLLILLFAGGLYVWLMKKPVERPTLALRLGETEAEILEEVERKNKYAEGIFPTKNEKKLH